MGPRVNDCIGRWTTTSRKVHGIPNGWLTTSSNITEPFRITSREEKIAYVPLSQLLRIEASPRGGIFLNFSENFQVNIEIADGAESAAVKSLYNELVSGSADPIRLNPETLNITHIHF